VPFRGVVLAEVGGFMGGVMRAICAVAFCFLVAACASYETTYFSRDENGYLNSKTVAGVPIVVTIPQKLGFIATESRFLIETTIVKDNKPAVATKETTEVSIDKTPISLGRSELVTLDIKRPAYGTAKTKMTLANQYPTEVSSDVDDKTLDRALDTIDKFIEKQGEQTPAASGNTTKTLISQRTYMIVYDPSTQHITRQAL